MILFLYWGGGVSLMMGKNYRVIDVEVVRFFNFLNFLRGFSILKYLSFYFRGFKFIF